MALSKVFIVLAAIFGALAVAAGAAGAHLAAQAPSLTVPLRIFDTGQLYHAFHSVALLGVAVILMVTEGKRAAWASYGLLISATAFSLGILCFSGGIYYQVVQGFPSSGRIVPFGGISFLVGWLSLAVSMLGTRMEN